MIRRLRIAVSVFFALVAVAFVVLWVRSYGGTELYSHDDGTLTTIGSTNGYIYFIRISRRFPAGMTGNLPYDWKRRTGTLPHGWRYGSGAVSPSPPRFEWSNTATKSKLTVPYWFIVSAVAAMAYAPWISRRFSLRTMLIATTLVAVVLGLAVWAGS
jgi:hypothetical protein